MPAAQILIFGYAVRTDLTNAGIAVLDNARDEVSAEITHKLEASEFFEIKYNLQSYDEIDPAFKKGKIKAVIIFPADIGRLHSPVKAMPPSASSPTARSRTPPAW
ncbi:MAG: hypothetical protein MZV63_17590 [Marinilabiliales bacterium]|nr:hypothetical protein [Marinilabiliales bacterium]